NWCGFSPDGRSFAAGWNPDTPIGIWDTASGRKLSTLPGAFPTFAFRPDGKALIAYADLSRLVAIDLDTKRVPWPTPPSLSGHWPGSIHFPSDGSTVLAERGDNAGNAWLCRVNVVTGEDEERGEPIVRSRGSIGVAPGGQSAAVGRTENGEW